MTGRVGRARTPRSMTPAHHESLPTAFWIKLASLDYVWINYISWFTLFGFDCEICRVHDPPRPARLPGLKRQVHFVPP